MRPSSNSTQKCSKHFIAGTEKITGMAKTSRTNCSLVLRHGRTCSKMCWSIPWIGKQQSGATLQSFSSLFGRPSVQKKGGIGNSWRIVRSLHINCLEMLVLGTYWKTWYSMVREQTCTIDHKMDQNIVTNAWRVWSRTFIVHVITNNIVMWETLPNNADWDCFKTLILQETLKTQNQPQVEHFCIFGSHTFVPVSWMCKKQTSVSHSSTESEIISLDAGLRLDGIPALDLWDLIVAVLHGNTYQSNQERRDPCANLVRAAPYKLSTRSNVHSSRQEALYIFEDNEAVIKMIMKGRSPTKRHVSRTHRVALDWLFDRINLDPKIQIKYIDTKNQLADILTGKFTRDE